MPYACAEYYLIPHHIKNSLYCTGCETLLKPPHSEKFASNYYTWLTVVFKFFIDVNTYKLIVSSNGDSSAALVITVGKQNSSSLYVFTFVTVNNDLLVFVLQEAKSLRGAGQGTEGAI